MSSPANDGAFSHSVSDVYDEQLVPMIFEPYAQDLANRLVDIVAGSILEVAAGTGVVTRAMAKLLPSAVAITATDLSQAMIDRAMRVGTDRPVRWEQANVMALPFERDSFDAVVCQFGVMFFDPKPEAFAEVHRVLLPGGRFLFAVWDGLDRNDFADVVIRAVNSLFPDNPVLFVERVPHGYHDTDRIVGDLRRGGFDGQPSIEQIEHRSRAATALDVARAFCFGTPLRGELEQRLPGRLDDAVEIAASALSQRFGPRDLDGFMSAQLVEVLE